MKPMKKLLAAVLVLALCAGMTMTAFAAGESSQMTVKYRKANSYVVTIPQTLDLSQSNTAEIKATYDIEPNKTLTVQISDGIDANGQIDLKRSDNATVTAQVKLGNVPVTPSTVLALFRGYSDTQTTGGSLTITPPTDAKAGSYSAVVTFSFRVA